MFTKLLVAVDLSPRNEDVFVAGLDLAKKTGASLILLHVPSSDAPECPTLPTMIGPDYYPLSGTASTVAIYEKLWRAYEEKGLEMLKQFAAKARQDGVEVEYTQTAGAPGKTICHLAHNVDADLILVGRRGHSGLNELVIGSVSNYVMHHASCSVLVVQHRDRMGIDPSEPEIAAMASS
jgi:nucleotide-binding universal stress UspA family protein